MEQIKLLLVDDEEDFVTALARRMNIRNFGANIALDGETALKMVESEIPDVVVLDLKMPGINGIEVLRNIKQHFTEIQVIILTGHGTDKEEKEAMDLGAFAFLNKPVDIDTLIGKIKEAYNHMKTKTSA